MSKTIASLQAVTAILAITAASVAYCEPSGHYRWKDAQGNTHYSDRPPEGTQSEFIKHATGKRAKPPAEESAEKAAAAEQDPTAGKRKMEVLPEKDSKLCKQARSNLEALAGTRIRITEPDGSQRILTDEEKEEQKINARKIIDMHCD